MPSRASPQPQKHESAPRVPRASDEVVPPFIPIGEAFFQAGYDELHLSQKVTPELAVMMAVIDL